VYVLESVQYIVLISSKRSYWSKTTVNHRTG